MADPLTHVRVHSAQRGIGGFCSGFRWLQPLESHSDSKCFSVLNDSNPFSKCLSLIVFNVNVFPTENDFQLQHMSPLECPLECSLECSLECPPQSPPQSPPDSPSDGQFLSVSAFPIGSCGSNDQMIRIHVWMCAYTPFLCAEKMTFPSSQKFNGTMHCCSIFLPILKPIGLCVPCPGPP